MKTTKHQQPVLILGGTLGKPTLTCGACSHTWRPKLDRFCEPVGDYRTCPKCGARHLPIHVAHTTPREELTIELKRPELDKLARIAAEQGARIGRDVTAVARYMIRNALRAYPASA